MSADISDDLGTFSREGGNRAGRKLDYRGDVLSLTKRPGRVFPKGIIDSRSSVGRSIGRWFRPLVCPFSPARRLSVDDTRDGREEGRRSGFPRLLLLEKRENNGRNATPQFRATLRLPVTSGRPTFSRRTRRR